MLSTADDLPNEEAMPQYTMPDANEAMPAEPDAPTDPADQPDASMADRAEQAVIASPGQAVQLQQVDAVRSPRLAAQQSPKQMLASPQQRVPTPVAHPTAQQPPKPTAATPTSAKKAAPWSKIVSPVSPLAALVPLPSSQRKPAAPATAASDLQARATQLAMQVPAALQSIPTFLFVKISFTRSASVNGLMTCQRATQNNAQLAVA